MATGSRSKWASKSKRAGHEQAGKTPKRKARIKSQTHGRTEEGWNATPQGQVHAGALMKDSGHGRLALDTEGMTGCEITVKVNR